MRALSSATKSGFSRFAKGLYSPRRRQTAGVKNRGGKAVVVAILGHSLASGAAVWGSNLVLRTPPRK